MALLSLFENNYENTLIWGLIGVFLDSFDGLVARAFGVTSEIGKQLDSLCDVVSFGVVPGYFMYKFLSSFLPYEFAPLSILAFVITLASIYRLARFNITPSSQLDFQGMPTPAFTSRLGEADAEGVTEPARPLPCPLAVPPLPLLSTSTPAPLPIPPADTAADAGAEPFPTTCA